METGCICLVDVIKITEKTTYGTGSVFSLQFQRDESIMTGSARQQADIMTARRKA